MGSKTKRKPKEAQKDAIVPRKVEEPEFTKVVDISDPWEGEEEAVVQMPKKPERPAEVELEKEKFATKESFMEKLSELRARIENKKRPKYHRGDVASRPRGRKKEKKSTYMDRVSRLGGIAGKRPGAKKKKKQKTMVFTEEELYGKEEAAKMAKLNKERAKKKNKKEGS